MLEHQVSVLISHFFPILRQQVCVLVDVTLSSEKAFQSPLLFHPRPNSCSHYGEGRFYFEKERQCFQVLTLKLARNYLSQSYSISVMNNLNAICV